MQFLGITFILYPLKLSAGNGFLDKTVGFNLSLQCFPVLDMAGVRRTQTITCQENLIKYRKGWVGGSYNTIASIYIQMGK